MFKTLHTGLNIFIHLLAANIYALINNQVVNFSQLNVPTYFIFIYSMLLFVMEAAF